MMTENELTLRIDTKYNRISIHRKTIAAIGDPTFIHFGYEPKLKSLMILGTWVDDTGAVRVSLTVPALFISTAKDLSRAYATSEMS